MNTTPIIPRLARLAAVAVLAWAAPPVSAFDPEDYEEDAGGSFAFLLSPGDDIYGISVGAGTWLKGTPVFGDYFVRLFNNGLEDAFYSGAGMTLRLMPHWRFAPFVGAGGSYNHSFKNQASVQTSSDENGSEADAWMDRGDSYWGGHAEAGFRLRMPPPLLFFELAGSYTRSSLDGDRDYWMVGIGAAAGI